jgi:hypothetical protein
VAAESVAENIQGYCLVVARIRGLLVYLRRASKAQSGRRAAWRRWASRSELSTFCRHDGIVWRDHPGASVAWPALPNEMYSREQ